jgi:hypothetical protein
VQADRSVRVRVLIGSGVHQDEATSVVEDIAAFYEPYGIGFRLERIGWVDQPSIVGETLATIEARLEASGVPLGTPEADALVASIALEPIRTFLERNAVPPRARIDLVILGDVADDDSITRRLIGDIAGIGVAPGALPDGLLPPDFTPTVFLGMNTLATLNAPQRAVVVAHEVAHSFGLVHDQSSWNLMNPELTDCVPGLSVEQFDQVLASTVVRVTP